MIEQYRELKAKHPQSILMFRLGDFYEMFCEDAVIGSRELGIVLTSREVGPGNRMPMCGVPHHAVDSYVATLVANGHTVAIADQVEDPKKARGLVRREVIRIVTPGTMTDRIEPKESNFLVAVVAYGSRVGLAVCDGSTGELAATEAAGPDALQLISDEVSRISPSECIYPDNRGDGSVQGCPIFGTFSAFARPAREFDRVRAERLLCEQFGVASLEGYGADGMEMAVGAAGALVSYLRETQMTSVPHITGIRIYRLGDFMHIDAATRRNLEVFQPKTGLVSVLDSTLTAMGGRLMRAWFERPSISVEEIQARLDAVAEFASNTFLRADVRRALGGVCDLERVSGRIGYRTAGPRDLLALAASLEAVTALGNMLEGVQSARLAAVRGELDCVPEACELVRAAISPDAPASVSDGGIIRAGFDSEIDSLRESAALGKEWILRLEAGERERTGIKSLKVGFNQVFGYYVEVTRANVHLVPEDYVRKQTLANAERYITPELKELESRILGAEERLESLEVEVYNRVREQIASYLPRVLRTARAVAQIDVLASFAEVAQANGYVRPVVDSGPAIVAREARHPVLEQVLGPSRYVPNDIEISREDGRVLIITGPNMAGKSTVLATLGLITLMAQAGSFVPAREATVGIADRIYYRTGSYDDISAGKSSFMVELLEVARILNTASERSLVLVDELGRGTSTYDGMALAWAVAEWLHDSIGCRTLFTTHYHELAALEERLPYARNYHVGAVERGGELTFLYRLCRGSVDRSYGVNVARMAGLPREVVRRAQQILRDLERAQPQGGHQMTLFGWTSEEPVPTHPEVAATQAPSSKEPASGEAGPSGVWGERIAERLMGIDPDELTPREALALVYELRALAHQVE
jgi:DNA mismatch repair protein MutS